MTGHWGQETFKKFDCNFGNKGPNVGAMLMYMYIHIDMVYTFKICKSRNRS